MRRKWKSDSEPTGPPWIRWLLGDDFFCNVVYVFLPPSKRVFFLKHDQGLSTSYQYTNGPPASDDDLQMVATIRGLETLDLSYAEIGDAGLAHLKGLTSLRCLELTMTDITDAGLQHLKPLISLKHLDLNGTKTTKAGVDDVANALPGCEIRWP